MPGLVDLTRYYRRPDYSYHWSEPKKIAVIYANGSIIDGESGYNLIDGKTIGSNTLARTLRKVRKDREISGIVLRVNSPGGDAFASEEIYRELELLKGKKPLIISMGSVAASGGYYISCIGDRIFSSPATITGSIGVVVGKADLSGFYEKIGVSHETIKRGRYSDMRSTSRAAEDDEIEKISGMVWHFYNDFISKVSTWRKMELDSVDAIGQGRVWTGNQALSNGLIDSHGGIWDAIEHCRQKAKIDPGDRVDLYIYPKYGFSLPAGFNRMGIEKELERFSEMTSGSKFNFKMPFSIEIQ
jgi:protease-4